VFDFDHSCNLFRVLLETVYSLGRFVAAALMHYR